MLKIKLDSREMQGSQLQTGQLIKPVIEMETKKQNYLSLIQRKIPDKIEK